METWAKLQVWYFSSVGKCWSYNYCDLIQNQLHGNGGKIGTRAVFPTSLIPKTDPDFPRHACHSS